LLLDLGIIASYFLIVLVIGLRSRVGKDVTPDQYFLSSRSLRWPSIAISTIATNIHAGHFIGMTGSAYLYGLAQANLEINAIFGILIAALFFVPLFLRKRVTTITQFLEEKLGPHVALAYSSFMIILYAFLFIGSALFWASYAIDGLFGELLGLSAFDPLWRLFSLAVVLAAFSAFYTYLGGLRAVVRTDVAQFVLLVGGGLVTVFLAIKQLGGWPELWTRTGDLMHLHLPRDHEALPWIGLFGMNLLNLNYWGANQVILQRALAAKDLRQAQIGLLAGGVVKYLMALIVVVPGIALAGILRDDPLDDPDQAYLTLVKALLPAGLRGLVLCGLFASLMSTVDSIYNSVSTMWSVDIYKRHLRPDASDSQMVRAARMATGFRLHDDQCQAKRSIIRLHPLVQRALLLRQERLRFADPGGGLPGEAPSKAGSHRADLERLALLRLELGLSFHELFRALRLGHRHNLCDRRHPHRLSERLASARPALPGAFSPAGRALRARSPRFARPLSYRFSLKQGKDFSDST
jgi:SSS family solute:Na+ symporter